MNKIYNNLSIENLKKTEWFNQFAYWEKTLIRSGLEKGLDEQKFIRIYSRFMVASGVLIFLSAFFDNRLGISIVIIFAILSAILPFYLAKKYRIKD